MSPVTTSEGPGEVKIEGERGCQTPRVHQTPSWKGLEEGRTMPPQRRHLGTQECQDQGPLAWMTQVYSRSHGQTAALRAARPTEQHPPTPVGVVVVNIAPTRLH